MEIPEDSSVIRTKYPQDNAGLEILENLEKSKEFVLAQEFAHTLEAPLCSSLVKPVSKLDMLESMSNSCRVSYSSKKYKICKNRDQSSEKRKQSKRAMLRKKIEVKDDHADKSELWSLDVTAYYDELTKNTRTTGSCPVMLDLKSFSKIIDPCCRHALNCYFKSRGSTEKILYLDNCVTLIRWKTHILLVDPPLWVHLELQKLCQLSHQQLAQYKDLLNNEKAAIIRCNNNFQIEVGRRTEILKMYLAEIQEEIDNWKSHRACLAVGPYAKEEPEVEVNNEDKDPEGDRNEEDDPEQVRNEEKDPEEVPKDKEVEDKRLIIILIIMLLFALCLNAYNIISMLSCNC